jgi:hypothetical protein
VSVDYAFFALLDAIEAQRAQLRDGSSRGAGDADAEGWRVAFEMVERVALAEANRLIADATVSATARTRARNFATAVLKHGNRSGSRPLTTPAGSMAGVPRTSTPAGLPSVLPSVLPAAVPPSISPAASFAAPPASIPRTSSVPGFGSPRAPTPATVPGMFPPRTSSVTGLMGSSLGQLPALSPTSGPVRARLDDHLVTLTTDWNCPHCGVDVAKTLHLSRVLHGRAAVVVDVVCAGCNRRSPLPRAQVKVFDSLYGALIGISGSTFKPDSHGFLWDNT